ncbi:MAG TPA: phospholipase D-like domain-containing protein [Bacteroidota bacterium]|nr:phospholipase D-like domain-containing protein [Bacteroidota bacterium]
MKRHIKLLLILLSGVLTASAQPANHIVISEVAPMGGKATQYNTGEFIELYNPFSVDVTFGTNVKIVSGATPPGTNAAEWEVSLAGKTIKAYGFLLIGDGGVSPAPDISFPSNKNLANSAARSCVQLRDGETVIDAFGWDASTTLLCETTPFYPSDKTSDGKSFERKSKQSATQDDSEGNAWDSNNNSIDFFQNSASTKNPQNSSSAIEINPYNLVPSDGKGAASVQPAQWFYSNPTELTFSLSSASDTIKAFRFVLSSSILNWNASNVSVVPSSAVLSFSGDTVIVSNIVIIGNDSAIVTIQSVTAVDTTTELSFGVSTSLDGIVFKNLLVQPSTLIYGSPRAMSMVKAKDGSGLPILYGKYAVVKGVVTVANEFGGPSYLEDATAAVAVYDSSVSRNVKQGDEIIVLGKVVPYNGLFELTPCQLIQVVSEGNAFDTLQLSIPQVKAQDQNGIEPYECRLIRINNITSVLTSSNSPATSWEVTGSGTNYKLISGSDTLEVRILPATNIVGTSIPSSTFDIVGVLGQYYSTYQLQPRSLNDIIVNSSAPRIISGIPYESSIGSTSVSFRWETDLPSSSIVYYGLSDAYGSFVASPTAVTIHEITLTELQPATVYHAKIGSAIGADTAFTFDYLFSTSSVNSTGAMNVYFNKSIDPSVVRAETAKTVNIYERLLARINGATSKIDAALYSLSGTVGSTIANALISAKSRGVQVRVIGENDNSSTAPWTTLSSNGINVIFDNVDAVNIGAGLMHNKFVVIDNGDDGDETNDWVWTGSWNATDPGNNNDAQNVIEIQDKALANAYTIEFNEMWGSSSATPNTSQSRFGSHKQNNTPHLFVINGISVELYFSPSDGTNAQLLKTFHKAQESVNFAILSFTRDDLGNELTSRFRNGVKVRGVFDNKTDSGCEYDSLVARGLDVHLKANLTGLLHHKYAIIDANGNDENKYVITGSHNWSNNAENNNDENTLIIKSPRIANLYLQEFSQRYKDAGGTDVLLGVESAEEIIPKSYILHQNFPNPFNPATNIQYEVPSTAQVTILVYDVLGRRVAQLVNEVKTPGVYQTFWNASSFPSGVYFCRMQCGAFSSTVRMLLVK